MIIELARAGEFNGEVLTKEILKEVVENFHGEVPIVLGHTYADFMPAFGWVKRVWLDGDVLMGEVELSDILKEAWDAGLYRKWSVGLRPSDKGYYLHHLAFWGAVPPKIKDLKVVNFSDAKDVKTFEFEDKKVYKSFAKTDYSVCLDCEWDAESAKKRIVEKYGWKKLSECVGAVETEDGKLPESYSKYKFPYCDVVNGEIKIIAKAVSSALAYLNGARGVKIEPSLERVVRPVFERLKERVERAKKEVEMSDKIKELEEKLKEYQKALKEKELAELKEVVEGKLPKDKTDMLLEFAEKLNTPIELSDGKKKSPIEILKEIFQAIPEPILDKELDMGDLPKKEENFNPHELLDRV